MRNLHNGAPARNSPSGNFSIHFGELMRQVAPLLGYDPGRADRKGVARYRSRGSLRIDFRQGLFADYEAVRPAGSSTSLSARDYFDAL